MAMSDDGGVIVVGVDDKESGEDAFVGSFLDPEWLRRRIHALTQPNYSIDEPEEIIEGGKRLYLINVPPALSEIRSGGKLRARFGTDCVEGGSHKTGSACKNRKRSLPRPLTLGSLTA